MKNVEELTDEELHSEYVFLKGRIKVNAFVTDHSREETHDRWVDVEYETKRRLDLEQKAAESSADIL